MQHRAGRTTALPVRTFHRFLLLLLVLTGCAPRVDAPSLLPRPFEKEIPAAKPIESSCADADVDGFIVSTHAQLAHADSDFSKAATAADASGPSGSEAWITAQSARSQAEVLHGQALDVISTIDSRMADLTNTGCDLAPYATLRSAAQEVVDRQAARLDALSR